MDDFVVIYRNDNKNLDWGYVSAGSLSEAREQGKKFGVVKLLFPLSDLKDILHGRDPQSGRVDADIFEFIHAISSSLKPVVIRISSSVNSGHISKAVNTVKNFLDHVGAWYEHHRSKKSGSEYFLVERPDDRLSPEVDVRVSDHNLPYMYNQPDLDIDPDSPARSGSYSVPEAIDLLEGFFDGDFVNIIEGEPIVSAVDNSRAIRPKEWFPRFYQDLQRRWPDRFNNVSHTLAFWHNTDPDRVESIMKDGLIPGKFPAPYQDWKAVHSDYAVYLHGSLIPAKRDHDDCGVAILRVDIPINEKTFHLFIPDEDVSTDYIDSSATVLLDGFSCAFMGKIPPKWISVVEAGYTPLYSGRRRAILSSIVPKVNIGNPIIQKMVDEVSAVLRGVQDKYFPRIQYVNTERRGDKYLLFFAAEGDVFRLGIFCGLNGDILMFQLIAVQGMFKSKLHKVQDLDDLRQAVDEAGSILKRVL